MLLAVATVTDKPVRWMVVGSVHGDHTGGMAALPADTVLVVHPDGLSQIDSGGRKVEKGPRAIGEVKSLDLGDRTVDILFLGRAHTASDLVVRVPDQKLVFMSEVFMNRVFPPMRSAPSPVSGKMPCSVRSISRPTSIFRVTDLWTGLRARVTRCRPFELR